MIYFLTFSLIPAVREKTAIRNKIYGKKVVNAHEMLCLRYIRLVNSWSVSLILCG